MIAPAQSQNLQVKPRWVAPVGVMESVVAYNCRKYGMPRPVLAMPMWEGAGNRALDYSGYGNHGTLTGQPEWVADGMDFDGASDYVTIPDSSSLNISGNEMGFSFWIYPDFIETDIYHHFIIDKTVDGIEAYRVLFNYSVDDFRFRLFTSSGGVNCDTLGLSWDVGTKHHIAGMYDGANMKIYWDGVLENTVAQTGNIITNNDNLIIGANAAGSQWFGGVITNTILFNTALSAAQIKFLYDNPYFMYRMPEELYGYVAAAADVSKQISLGTDDCEEHSDTSATLDGTISHFGNDGTSDDLGLRWQSVDIPQAATITSAKLSLYLYWDDGTLSANIRGIDEDNTVTWATDDRPSQRSKTTATITANEANWNNWATDSWIDIDITSVIQEIIDRGGWSANNALAIVIENTSGSSGNYSQCRMYEYAGNLHGAKLDVVYSTGVTIPIFLHHYNQLRGA